MDELKKIKTLILKDEEINKFVFDHKIDGEMFENNLSRFITQYQNNLLCKKCMGKMDCLLDMEGMQTHLEIYKGKVILKYHDCPHYPIANNNFLEMLFYPKNNYVLREEIYKETNERKIFTKMTTDFLVNYKKGTFIKGFYVHGNFGTGKSFLLLKLANNLAKNNIKVIFAYYPDLIRNLKSSIGDGSLESYINKLKTVDILMLDDVGAEPNSAFVRDEILGSILQYRMLGNLPVFMSSNSDLTRLREHFIETKDETNKVNSDRIMERINYLMNVVELKEEYRFYKK